MFKDKSKTIYGESKSVALSSFRENEMVVIIQAHLGHDDHLNLTAMREALSKARADPDMKEAYVKVGIVGSDLVWRAKAKKGTGPKEYSAILLKNYVAAAARAEEEFREQARIMKQSSTATAMAEINQARDAESAWSKYDLKAISRETAEKALKSAEDGAWFVRTGSDGGRVYSRRQGAEAKHLKTGAGKGPKEAGLDERKQIKTKADLDKLVEATEFKEAIETVQAMPGYFTNLSAVDAAKKLENERAGSWLVRGSSSQAGVVSWTHKIVRDKDPVVHERITNLNDYQLFIKYIRGSGRMLQVTK